MKPSEEAIKFVEENKNNIKRNMLHPYLNDIEYLRNNKITIVGIQKFLKNLKGVETSTATINKFIKKFIENKN
ncbi:hypothetical protein [Taylorella equigenitalis]|uniref:Uncharacterized protein n=2 Tax=Taylorella equigenitalis TaxID=29575 RepID=I7J004_9BURK|nr:hypothetical protein [Taylorella equigenitalis]AFN36307.1 hypothetical protein KUI_1248 [Taylorella equigenitalis ATCC 35865]ASY39708.1 hypothetical protein CA604_06260 [Taylorella equigenitalis]WEE00087.1 hypothetical protein PZB79_05790 [Taylorella equigenitalis]WEE01564.1 hypothetical protein PZB80_05795 [Taylorella equigenitalis]WFD78101.1 hypothetical protein P7C95_05805 [Taylorella equigenitalis]